MPITKNILEIITNQLTRIIKDLNIDEIFKIVLTDFLHLGKIIYISTELKKNSFIEKFATKSDILFIKSDQYAIFKLKHSKIDIDNLGVQIMFTTTDKLTCLVKALRHVFQAELQPANAFFFCLNSKAFSRKSVNLVLKKKPF